jgi:hypothetical protein
MVSVSSGVKSLSKNMVGKNVTKMTNSLSSFCSPDNLIACFITLAVIAYVVILNPVTVLEMFATSYGKLIAMLVFLGALCLDVKVGVLVGVAVVLSIVFAHMNKEMVLSESMEDDDYGESFEDQPLSSEMDDDDETEEEEDDEEVEEADPAAPVGGVMEEVEDEEAEEFSNYSNANF